MSGGAGVLLAGRYRLLDQVAVGAMGEVWRAHDDRLDRDVAVKVLRPELADDQDFLDRFRGEARHAASVRHPHVAAVHDYGEDPAVMTGGTATAYLVMELLDGRHLGTVLAETGPLPGRRVARLLAQVADALAAAHRTGLVHRDVKPANLVVSGDRPDDVTVTDFGIARAADAVPVTRTGLVMGTAEYLSPEQARGRRATTASDVYSLGVVAYELLSGRPPFTGASAPEVARAHVQDPLPPLPDDVDEAMRLTVQRCLAKDPDARPGAEDLAARLRALAQGRTEPDPAWSAEASRPTPAGSTPAGSTQPGSTQPGSRQAGSASPARPASAVPATAEIPVVPGGRARTGVPAAPRVTPASPRRRRRGPLRAPLVALLALLALVLLAAALQQLGVLGAGDGAAAGAQAHVTRSPVTTTDEDGP